jgi:hypothetical protein
LFSSERGEFFPISHFNSLVFRSSCFLFLMMCSLHVNLLSRCSPRYFTVDPWGMVVWLMRIGGHYPLRIVNVICVDLFWLTFILHFWSHFSMLVRWSCRFLDAVVRSESLATIAVTIWSNNLNNFCSLYYEVQVQLRGKASKVSFSNGMDICTSFLNWGVCLLRNFHRTALQFDQSHNTYEPTRNMNITFFTQSAWTAHISSTRSTKTLIPSPRLSVSVYGGWQCPSGSPVVSRNNVLTSPRLSKACEVLTFSTAAAVRCRDARDGNLDTFTRRSRKMLYL